nr:CHAT domain-containing protein [Prolixibacteraceae bacterium]
DNLSSYSVALFGVAQTYFYLNEFDKALDLSLEYLSSNNIQGLSFKQLIGNIYTHIGKNELAIDILYEVSTEYYLLKSEKYSNSLLALGSAYLKNNEIEKAEKYLDEALPILRKVKSPYDPWMVYYYEIYGQLLMAKAEQESNDYYKLANYTEAVTVFDKALVLNSQTKNNNIPYLDVKGEFITPTQVKDVFINRTKALKGIGQIYAVRNDVFTARNFYDRSLKNSLATVDFLHDLRISFINEESKLNLSEQYSQVYADGFNTAEYLYNSTNLNSYFENMLQFSESAKSATFLASLNDVKAKNFGGIPDSLVIKEKDLKMQLSSIRQLLFSETNLDEPDSTLLSEWEKTIFTLEQKHDELIFLFEREYPDFYDFKYKNNTISTEAIVDKLERDQALIEYFVDEPIESSDSGFIYAMVFTSEGYNYSKTSIGYNYIENLESIMAELTNKNIGDTNGKDFISYTNSAYELHQQLIEPLNLSEKITDLIIVPDGKLAYLPFDALLTALPKNESIDFRSLEYLVFNYNITYSYSATLHFDYFKKSERKGRNILAFAPEYNDTKVDLNKAAYRNRQASRSVLRSLPGARAEVAGLSNFQKCEAYFGEDASEMQFKKMAANYDILHLAMHTIINDSIPMFSKLVFSTPTDTVDDGYLNTQEVYNLKLDARLTVLSACNTGSGKMRAGEGVMSLSRAFLYAGCPAIVMTLWEVEDKVSADLMLDFYRYLFKGYSKPEALRKAKLNHIATADPLKAHPYFWLGYIFVGDASPIKFNSNVLISIIVFSGVLLVLWLLLSRYFRERKKAQH